MNNKKILNELKRLVRERGRTLENQIEYALVEERAMQEICPIQKPYEEKRFSQFRTLERYIGEKAAQMMMRERLSFAAPGQKN
jgi:hypothetical protein